MTEVRAADRRRRAGRIAGAVTLAILLPGCIDLPEESKDLLRVFIVLLAVNVFMQFVLMLMLVFYFLPFTRPRRRRRRK